ncbi:MAG TPA: hypothetical protein VHO25_17640, partial [Polyangiaceae bacterium]|nr:hypothetical protein [Polyangiaceae bacterium]
MAVALRSLVIAAALVLIPSLLISRSALHRHDVPWLLRGSGLFVEWVTTATVLLPAFALLARSRRTAASQTVAAALIALSITWLTLSWGLFYGSGQFLSTEAIAFASDNGSQLFKHFLEFNPIVTATIPVILGTATFAVLLLGKKTYPENRQRSNLVSLCAIALLGASLLTLRWTTLRSVSSLSTNSTTGAVDLTSNKWRRYLAKEVGPLSSLATRQLNEVTGDGELWPMPQFALPEYRRGHITIEQYLAQVPSDAKRYNVLLIL